MALLGRCGPSNRTMLDATVALTGGRRAKGGTNADRPRPRPRRFLEAARFLASAVRMRTCTASSHWLNTMRPAQMRASRVLAWGSMSTRAWGRVAAMAVRNACSLENDSRSSMALPLAMDSMLEFRTHTVASTLACTVAGLSEDVAAVDSAVSNARGWLRNDSSTSLRVSNIAGVSNSARSAKSDDRWCRPASTDMAAAPWRFNVDLVRSMSSLATAAVVDRPKALACTSNEWYAAIKSVTDCGCHARTAAAKSTLAGQYSANTASTRNVCTDRGSSLDTRPTMFIMPSMPPAFTRFVHMPVAAVSSALPLRTRSCRSAMSSTTIRERGEMVGAVREKK